MFEDSLTHSLNCPPSYHAKDNIDFISLLLVVLNTHYPSAAATAPELQGWSGGIPRDPFPIDIYYLRNMFKQS